MTSKSTIAIKCVKSFACLFGRYIYSSILKRSAWLIFDLNIGGESTEHFFFFLPEQQTDTELCIVNANIQGFQKKVKAAGGKK